MSASVPQHDRRWISGILESAAKLESIVAKRHDALHDYWYLRDTVDRRLMILGEAAGNIINHQRRRSLHHQSPAELYAALTVQ